MSPILEEGFRSFGEAPAWLAGLVTGAGGRGLREGSIVVFFFFLNYWQI